MPELIINKAIQREKTHMEESISKELESCSTLGKVCLVEGTANGKGLRREHVYR